MFAPNCSQSEEHASSTRKILEDLKELEAGLIKSESWQQWVFRMAPQRQSRTVTPATPSQSRDQTLFSCQSFLGPSFICRDCVGEKRISGAFVTFYGQLLYVNHIWKQERQLRALRASIQALKNVRCPNVFKAFCDRLLLSNRVWQLERQVQELAAEGKRNKRARVVISRTGQQMAEGVRKETMIEELVMELVKKLQESREALYQIKEAHEREIRAIPSDWLKEYHRVARENEQLKLERHAKSMEQEISNEFEHSLWRALGRSRQRIQNLKCGEENFTLVGGMLDQGSILLSSAAKTKGLEVDMGISMASSATRASVEQVPDRLARLQLTLQRKLPQRRDYHGGNLCYSKNSSPLPVLAFHSIPFSLIIPRHWSFRHLDPRIIDDQVLCRQSTAENVDYLTVHVDGAYI